MVDTSASGHSAARTSSPEPLADAAAAPSTSTAPPPATAKKLNRQRSSSLQKGAAVLRALSRAESDFDRQQILLAQASGSDPAAATIPTQDGSAIDDDAAAIAAAGAGASNGAPNTDPASSLRKRGAAASASATSTSSPSSSGDRPPASATSDTTVQPDRKRDRVKATALPTSQPTKKSWEIPRKIFHSSIGGLVLYLYLSNTDLRVIVRNLSYFLGIVVTADVIRLNNADFEALYEKVLGFLMRESEKEKVNGVVWYLVGVITSLHFFPEDIACVSIMILSWCDTAASTFGRLFGRYTPPLPSPPFARRKSTAGFLAAIVSGALTSYLFWCTSIASSGERPNGISWSGSGPAHPAVFGTLRAGGLAPGSTTGWMGLARGFSAQSGAGLLPSSAAGAGVVAGQYLGAESIAAGKLGTDAVLPSLSSTTAAAGDVPGMPWWMLTLGSGIVAGVAEGLELGGVDDNLSLPILSATGIWAMLFTWGKVASLWR